MTAPLCVHCTSHDRRACEGVRQFATITASCSCGCHFAPQVGGAVVLVSDAADALRRELAALRQTHAGDLARERERVEAAERECERRGAELARVRAAVRMHESAREQMDAHDRATLRSLAGDSRAVLIEELAGARRERDDWNARATSLEFERDAAIADAAGLRAVAPRTTPPTEAEAAAHNAALGWWLISREGVAPPAAVDAFRGDGDVTAHLPFVRGATWLPLDRDGRPTAWPVAAAEAATQRAGEGGVDG